MERRNTIQKELVLNTVRSMMSHVTAEDVYEQIKGDYPSIGKGTVYRNLGILADEGQIRRVGVPNGPDRFDFTLKEHYHAECAGCGMICDVDMEAIPNMMDRVKDTRGMKFIDYDILFKGICSECQKRNQGYR